MWMPGMERNRNEGYHHCLKELYVTRQLSGAYRLKTPV